MDRILYLTPTPTILLSPSKSILQISHSFTQVSGISPDYVAEQVDSVVSLLGGFGDREVIEGIDLAVKEGNVVVTEAWQVESQFWRVKVTPLFSLGSAKRRSGGGVKSIGERRGDIPKSVENIWNHVTLPNINNQFGNINLSNHTNSANKLGKRDTPFPTNHHTTGGVTANPSRHRLNQIGNLHRAPLNINNIEAVTPNEDGLEYILLEWEDVTEDTGRIQTLKNRLQSSEIYRLLVNTVKDYAIFLLDSDGYIATWNTGAMLLKQYKPHEIIGPSHISLSSFNPACSFPVVSILDILCSRVAS